MREVAKDEFFKKINEGDIISNVVGNFPYTSEFKERYTNAIIGKIVDSFPRTDTGLTKTYYLRD